MNIPLSQNTHGRVVMVALFLKRLMMGRRCGSVGKMIASIHEALSLISKHGCVYLLLWDLGDGERIRSSQSFFTFTEFEASMEY